jgi:hypothetical protein
MITNLEERKTDLLYHIEELKREIDILKWPKHKELALLCCADSVRYPGLDRLQGNSRN